MWPASIWVKEIRVPSMWGSRTIRESMITMIFGTKVSVISWIWVSACSTEMQRPTTSASSITGAPILSATMIASLPISSMSLAFTGDPLPPRRSDRHLDDVLVGGNHLVPHRDHGLQRGIGVGERGGDLGDVRLAGDALQAGLLRVLQGVDGAAGGLLHQLGEALAAGAVAGVEARRGQHLGGIGIG